MPLAEAAKSAYAISLLLAHAREMYIYIYKEKENTGWRCCFHTARLYRDRCASSIDRTRSDLLA